jgi:hypothetical protein
VLKKSGEKLPQAAILPDDEKPKKAKPKRGKKA